MMNRKFKRTAFILNVFCNDYKCLKFTFDQVNASLLNKSINFFNFVLLIPVFLTVVHAIHKITLFNNRRKSLLISFISFKLN